MAAVITEDFRLYHSLVEALRKDRVPFVTLGLDEHLPPNIGVVITTSKEKERIEHNTIVTVSDNIWLAVTEAQSHLSGKERYEQLIIGIDPGPRPGLAVLGDGDVVKTAQLERPEDASSVASNIISAFKFDDILIRVGHGDPNMRNRVINSLFHLEIPIEMVNETSTSGRGRTQHADAAIDIAGILGTEISLQDAEDLPIEPTEGELKELQRRSRIASGGKRTISKDDARKVVSGEKSMEEALEE